MRHIRPTIIFLLVINSMLTGTGCVGKTSRLQAADLPYDPAKHYYALRSKEIQYRHLIVDSSIKKGDLIEEGRRLGSVEPLPSSYSKRFNNIILQAEQLYDRGKYEDAVQLLLPAFRDEPDNLFLLNTLARSMYWTDAKRTDSFLYYKKLVASLDAQNNSVKDMIVIDLWFQEAYWKLGTLYLDRREYEKGAFEITRAIAAGINQNPKAYEQALGYLTEAYYYMGDYNLSKYFSYQTLLLNPKNQYVIEFAEIVNNR